jgi:hypothetical protein
MHRHLRVPVEVEPQAREVAHPAQEAEHLVGAQLHPEEVLAFGGPQPAHAHELRHLVPGREDRDPHPAQLLVPVGPHREILLALGRVGRSPAAQRLVHAEQEGLGAQQLAVEPGAGMARMVRRLLDEVLQGLYHNLRVSSCEGLVKRSPFFW